MRRMERMEPNFIKIALRKGRGDGGGKNLIWKCKYTGMKNQPY